MSIYEPKSKKWYCDCGCSQECEPWNNYKLGHNLRTKESQRKAARARTGLPRSGEAKAQHPNSSGPLERMEPGIIAVDFIRYLCGAGRIDSRDSGTYLYRSEKDVSSVVEIDLDNPDGEK